MLFGAAQAVFAGPIDVFSISQPTHAVVDSHTNVYPCCGADNSNTFSTGYIYNIFGAANTGVEGTGDMLFEDGHTTDFVDFHTSTPVNLGSVALEVGAESAGSDGPRGVLGAWTFQAFTDGTYTTPLGAPFTFSPTSTAPSGVPMVLPVSITGGQYFEIKMPTNTTYGNGGVRVHSLQGFVPEPASLGLVCLGGLGLLARRR